jgi:hypothetical protein
MRRRTLVSFVLLAIAALAFAIPQRVRAQPLPEILISPSTATVPSGATFTLMVNFTNFSNTEEGRFTLWNIFVETGNNIISPTAITLVETFNGTATVVTNCINDSGVNCGAGDGPGVAHSEVEGTDATYGNGTLFSITYKAIAGGTTQVGYVPGSTVHEPDGDSIISCQNQPALCVAGSVSVTDFGLSSSPSAVGPIAASANGLSTITVFPINGFTGTVNLATAAPSGVSASLGSGSVSITSTAHNDTLTVKSATDGLYYVNITGSSPGYESHVISVEVIVGLNYTLNASPATIGPLAPSTSGISTITITGMNGFSGTVQLALSSPAAVTASLNATSINISPSTPSSAVQLTLQGTSVGNFPVDVIGSCAGFPNRTAVVTLEISGFAVSATPNSLGPLNASAAGSSIVTVTGLNGFSGTVILSLTPSSGLQTSLNETSVDINSITTTASALLTVSSSVPGAYTVTVTGSLVGFPSQNASVTVSVVGFSMTANPTALENLLPGVAGTSVLTIDSVNGFTGTVNLVVAPSSGFSASLSASSVVLTSVVTSQTVQLTVTEAAGTLVGNYAVIVTGSSPGFSSFNLMVMAGVPLIVSVGTPSLSATSVTVGDMVVVNFTLTGNGVSSTTVPVALEWGNSIVAQENVTLLSGQSTQVSLKWDTTGFSAGSKTLSISTSGTVKNGPVVTLSSANSLPFSITSGYFLIILGIVAGFVISCLSILLRRRKR